MPGARARKFTDNQALPRNDTVCSTRGLKNYVTMQWGIYHFGTRRRGGGRIERRARTITLKGQNAKMYVSSKPLRFNIWFSLTISNGRRRRGLNHLKASPNSWDLKCIDIRMSRGAMTRYVKKRFVMQKLPSCTMTKMKLQIRTQSWM